MRLAVFLLLLANALLFAYARVDRASVSEPGRLAGQIQPDSIKLLTPQQVAALGLDRSPIAAGAQAQAQSTGQVPGPGASPPPLHSQAAAPAQGAAQTSTQAPAQPSTPADVCAQWGPFSDADRAKAQADLEALKLGRQLSQHQVTVTDAWWVSLGPMPTRSRRRSPRHGAARAVDRRSVGRRFRQWPICGFAGHFPHPERGDRARAGVGGTRCRWRDRRTAAAGDHADDARRSQPVASRRSEARGAAGQVRRKRAQVRHLHAVTP